MARRVLREVDAELPLAFSQGFGLYIPAVGLSEVFLLPAGGDAGAAFALGHESSGV